MKSLALTINLRLPDGVSYSVQTRDREKDKRLVWGGSPEHEHNDDSAMHHHSEENDGNSSSILHDRTEDDRAYRIDNAEADHNIADLGDSKSTGYIRL